KLRPQAKTRCLTALKAHSATMNDHNVEEVIAVGTEALRRASDGREFLQTIREETDIAFRIIDGKEEARLTFRATQEEFGYLRETLLMFDIGGGSTEIVAGDKKRVISLDTFPVGTVSLTEQFVHHDPVSAAEMRAAGHLILRQLAAVSGEFREPAGIGVAGTITTLKAVSLQMESYDHSAIHKSTLTLTEVDDLVNLFASMTSAERLALKGLPAMRADIIPMGALMARTIMSVFGLSEIYVSDRGLRWGVLYDWLEKQ
ncbi:MAG: hypothetical protein ACE5GH_06815, partial [Fidelibacterota bacterium]